MAVYKRNYKRYSGTITPQRWRFMIVPRYALRTLFESKLNSSFFTLCFLPIVLAILIVYLHNSLDALEALNIQLPRLVEIISIDGNFFLILFRIQSFLAFLLVTWIGPGLIAPDLANNALPLYFSRPFTRKEYVVGKLTVLVGLTSLITWIPGLVLVGMQTNMAGAGWFSDNSRIPAGIVAGSFIWIFTISLIALALSAWVRLKPVAAIAMFGTFFIAARFGDVVNTALQLDPQWGKLLDLTAAMRMIWNRLLLGEHEYLSMPTWTGLASMLVFCALSILMLGKKIRSVEVTR